MPTLSDQVLQLKIQLVDIRPPIWRRVLVLADATPGDLHAIIQRVFDWDNSHLHELFAGGKRYGTPDPGGDDWGGSEVLDENSVTINQLLRSPKSSILYTYDFGDDWQHKVTLEKRLPRDPSLTYPRCTGGKRAGPPEDSGGAWGYLFKLEILKDPSHPEYEETAEWVGEDFDPELFSLAATNAVLSMMGRRR